MALLVDVRSLAPSLMNCEKVVLLPDELDRDLPQAQLVGKHQDAGYGVSESDAVTS